MLDKIVLMFFLEQLEFIAKKTSLSGLPEGIYNVPTTPPCDPLLAKTESFYVHPKVLTEISNPPALKNDRIQNASKTAEENKYCTMTGSLNTDSNPSSQKPSPSHSVSSGNTKFDNIPQNSSLYVPMMPQ